MLKQNHGLDICTQCGGQEVLRAAELLSGQHRVPPASRELRAAGPTTEKLSSTAGGAREKGRKQNTRKKSSCEVK